jgi:nucleoside-diphosphate-sugar epimerase
MNDTNVLILGGHGYVGSALSAHLLDAGFDVQSVDLGVRGLPGPAPNWRKPYQELKIAELEEFGSIILLAGHPSVSACASDPVAAFNNNVCGFVELVHKLRGQKLIYASSISVYVDTHGRQATEDDPLAHPVSYYDLHKQSLERYATLAYPNSYGLRFGTVCGPSPNIRDELLLNSLVLSGVRDGYLRVANRQAHRPLLGITDLCRAVEAILTREVPPGVYNLATTNVQVGEAAGAVGRCLKVRSQEVELPNNYDVQVCCDRFRKAAGFEFQDDVAALVDDLWHFYLVKCGAFDWLRREEG